MGMDAYLVRCRNLKQPDLPNFWNECINMTSCEAWTYEDNYDKPAKLWYGRKNWGLHNEIFGDKYECGEWVEVTKDTLEKMLEYASHNPDYFNGFDTVPALCRALYDYDDAHGRGFMYAYESDW